MATKIVNTGDSSSALWAVVVLVIVAIIAYAAYSQGMFGGQKHEVNINLPDGKQISGSVKE